MLAGISNGSKFLCMLFFCQSVGVLMLLIHPVGYAMKIVVLCLKYLK